MIPFGIMGGLVALALAGESLSFTAMIGFVALVGIEIKNSILLVEFANQQRARGVALREAIERAGEVRFLPVLLTSLTAIGGLSPLVFEHSPLYSPLAMVSDRRVDQLDADRADRDAGDVPAAGAKDAPAIDLGEDSETTPARLGVG